VVPVFGSESLRSLTARAAGGANAKPLNRCCRWIAAARSA
jgi:hypothetical protein